MQTKRQTFAHVLVCSGCCCGRVDKGRPEVPVDWLKNTWKARKLQKQVQLTISGCLGPCDLVNVVCIGTEQDQIWLGGIIEREQFEQIVEWATSVAQASELLDLPDSLQAHQFSRFLSQPIMQVDEARA